MPQYRANSNFAISELFTQEGDALEKAGYTEPDLKGAPEDYKEHIAKLIVRDQKPEVING